MQDIAWLDFETLSLVNLKTQGLQRYAEDLSTEVICLGWAINDAEVQCWFPEDEPFPQELIDHVNAGGIMYAHNSTFDRLIWEFVLTSDYDVPTPKLEQWRCSSARAMAHGLPAGLGDICKAVNLPIQKQTEGTRLINTYSVDGGQPWKGDDKELMSDYCIMDVETMRMFCSLLRELTDEEWQEYHRNEQVNELGIPIDVEFATAALGYASEVKADVNDAIKTLTKGKVPTALARKTRDEWLFPLLTEAQKQLLVVHKDGKKKYSLDQEHRDNLLEADGLNPEVEKFIHLLNDAGGSSTSKYKSMVNTHVDGRVHNALVWHGAATGRWASKGIQIHNMPRKAYAEPQALIDDVLEDYEIEHPASTLSKLLRAAVTAPAGITYGDWAAIEGRVCPWLSNDPEAQDKLDVFRRDEDVYVATARDMGMDDRQAGKVCELSMQFAGGKGALLRMARAYGTVYTDEQAEHLKTRWRYANKWCVRFWYGLQDAAKNAHANPGIPYTCGKATFQSDGEDWLWMRRPSGHLHAYFQPRIELVEYPWGDEGYELTVLAGSVKPKAGKKWPRRTLTPGTIIENLVQGTAADLLRYCMMQAEFPVFASIHDEILAEGDQVDEMKTLMETLPAWAEGLPIKAEVKHAQRFGK